MVALIKKYSRWRGNMDEANLDQVILDISNLCEGYKNKIEMRKNSNTDLSCVDGYIQRAKDREELSAYLINLTDDTLNTICALMDLVELIYAMYYL